MSKIGWTDVTWNPLIGCSRVSEGCVNCYAERVAAMIVRTKKGRTPYAGVVTTVGGRPRWTNAVRRNTDERFDAMRATRPRTPPRRVFVNSMSDLFHDKALAAGLTGEVYDEMRACRWNVYQVLTKRPENAARFYAGNPQVHALPHVWLGTSVEDARVAHRIGTLRSIPAGLRFLSIEPLIAPVGRIDLSGIGWVIVGGESGPGHRPMQADWAREVRDQCVAARVPFFFKQWGGPAAAKRGRAEVLDGREWKEFPR